MLDLILTSDSYKNFCKLIEFDKLSHAYLITSPDEDYNREFCKLIALRLNCKGVCKTCESCVKILNDTHPDVLSFPKNKSFVVDDAKSIIEELNVMPMLSNIKIFIINNFNKSTVQAQNKLLKSIEEPPKNVIFLINATSLESILPTIQSRTQKFELLPLNTNVLKEYFNNNGENINENALIEGEGWPGKTIKYNQNQSFIKNCEFIENLLKEMKSSKDVLNFSSIFSQKDGFEERLNLLENAFDKILNNIASGEESAFTKEAVAMIFEKINLAKKEFLANCNLNLISDTLLLGILEVKYICK